MMRSASRWVARNCATVSGCQRFSAGGVCVCATISSVRRNNSAVPPLRTAMDVTTGTPSASDSRGYVDGHATAGGDVEHVEHQHQRTAGALELEQQADRQAQIGGIGDAQHQVGHGLAGAAAEHHVAGDLFIRAAAAQRVGAGQIDDRHLAAGRA